METAITYPQYFRRAGTCLKVVSDTQAKVIVLPPDAAAAERFTSTYPSPARLQEELATMQPATEQTFRDFLLSFYTSVIDERVSLIRAHRELRAQEIDAARKSQLSPVSLEEGEVAS